jgi:uncharacterized spore protein YtfJ
MTMENIQENNKAGRPSFIEQLAQRLGISASATTVYGQPVERGDVTVIPVAKARYGFGGGSGTNKKGDEGSGGGGGVAVTPIGYIEIKDGKTQFRKIRDPQSLITALAVGGIFTFLTVRSLSKMLQRKSAVKPA